MASCDWWGMLGSPWVTSGGSGREWQVRPGTHGVCAVGKARLELICFAVPWGKAQIQLQNLPNFSLHCALSSLPTPPCFFKPRLLKKRWKLFMWGLEFLEASCWFCSPGTGLLGFLSSSEVENMLTIVQVKYCSRCLLIIASVTSVMGLQLCYFIFECTSYFLGIEEGRNESYAIVPSSRACCGWQLFQPCTRGAGSKLFLLLSCCLLWGLSVI